MRKLLLVLIFVGLPLRADKLTYWDEQRRGANFFNEVETAARFREAREAGVGIVRLVFSKWKSHRPGAKAGDFLFGSLDQFEGLVEKDLAQLISTLDAAEAAGVKVALATLNLPGARWKQQNEGKLDNRLWTDLRFHEQSARFWGQLARRLAGHPAVVAYNPLNEPYPEAAPPRFEDWFTQDYLGWYKKVEGSASDLNRLYRAIAKAIREGDQQTPLLLDSGFYATPFAFRYLSPLADPRTLYSFHMYEPYAFTSYENEGKYRYPGPAPIGEAQPPPVLDWNQAALDRLLDPVREWSRAHTIPARRIFASEFGGGRRNEGMGTYLKDLISIFNRDGFHWAFYSYREDTWTGMDYELGDRALPPGYTEAIRKKLYVPNPMWDALSKGLRGIE